MKLLNGLQIGTKNEKSVYTNPLDKKQGDFLSEQLIAASYLQNHSPTMEVAYTNRVVVEQNKSIFDVVYSSYPVLAAYCPWLLTVNAFFGQAYVNSTTPSLTIKFKTSSKTLDNTTNFYCTTVLPSGEYSGFDYVSTGVTAHQTHKLIPAQMAMPSASWILLDYLPHIPQHIAMPHIMLATGAPDEIVTLQVPHSATTTHYQASTTLAATGTIVDGQSTTALAHSLTDTAAFCSARRFQHFMLVKALPDWVRACHPQSYFIIPSTTTSSNSARHHKICVCISSTCQNFGGVWRWVGFFITQMGQVTLDTAFPDNHEYTIQLGYWA